MLQPSLITNGQPAIVIIQGAYFEHSDPMLNSPQYKALATTPPVENWIKFERLVDEWRAQRGAMSSITDMALCPAYQSIIGMGGAAIPLILVHLESEGDDPDQWFWALRAIRPDADPVQDEDRGNNSRMARSWIDWATSEGYVW